MTARSDAVWPAVGKISVVVTLLGGLTGLYLFISPNGPSVSVEAVYEDLSLPPDLIEAWKKLRDAQSCTAISAYLDKRFPEAAKRNDGSLWDAARAVCEPLEAALPEIVKYPSSGYGGIWRLQLRNSGNRAATNVVLDTPFTGIARVTGDQARVEQVDRAISLGTIRAGATLSVLVWVKSGAGLIYADDIRLTHTDGIGSVSVARPIFGWRATVAGNLGFIVLMLCMFISMGAAPFIERAIIRRRSYALDVDADDDADGDADAADGAESKKPLEPGPLAEEARLSPPPSGSAEA